MEKISKHKPSRMSLLIGVCGRTGSGKTTAAKLIQTVLEEQDGLSVGVLSMDDFYRELSEEEHRRALANDYDFDCLESFDRDALRKTIGSARDGQALHFRAYDHASHKHSTDVQELGPFDVVVFEGLYLFADSTVADLFDLRIFMEVDADESLIRRVRRDIVKRRRSVEGVLEQYERYVKPAYERLVKPSKRHADIIIPRGAHNTPAMNSVYSYIRSRLRGGNGKE